MIVLNFITCSSVGGGGESMNIRDGYDVIASAEEAKARVLNTIRLIPSDSTAQATKVLFFYFFNFLKIEKKCTFDEISS